MYLLSFVSYNAKLFNFEKWVLLINKRDWNLYKTLLFKYGVECMSFAFIIFFIFLGYMFLKNKIKESQEKNVKITTIKKKEPDNLVLYTSAYLLPSLGAYYKVPLLWFFIYELFLFIIYCRHINFHYKILLGFLYNSYLVEVKGGKIYTLYTRKKINNIDEITDNEIALKFLDFSFDYWEDDILFLNKWHH